MGNTPSAAIPNQSRTRPPSIAIPKRLHRSLFLPYDYGSDPTKYEAICNRIQHIYPNVQIAFETYTPILILGDFPQWKEPYRKGVHVVVGAAASNQSELEGALREINTAMWGPLEAAYHRTINSVKLYALSNRLRDNFLGPSASAGSEDTTIMYFVEAESIAAVELYIKSHTGGHVSYCSNSHLRGSLGSGQPYHIYRTSAGTINDYLQSSACVDFTFNAIAKAPDGIIVDPLRGQADIDHGVIRCVGDASINLAANPIRMLRALRHQITMNPPMQLDQGIVNALHDPTMVSRLQNVADPIQSEINQMLRFDTPLALNILGQYPLVIKTCFGDKYRPQLVKLVCHSIGAPAPRGTNAVQYRRKGLYNGYDYNSDDSGSASDID